MVGKAARDVDGWSSGTGDWLLFTDADVHFKPDSLRRVIAYAEAEPADHMVLFPRMIISDPGERMMIAFFRRCLCSGIVRGRLRTRILRITWESVHSI